jgi:hypothetical protein
MIKIRIDRRVEGLLQAGARLRCDGHHSHRSAACPKRFAGRNDGRDDRVAPRESLDLGAWMTIGDGHDHFPSCEDRNAGARSFAAKGGEARCVACYLEVSGAGRLNPGFSRS